MASPNKLFDALIVGAGPAGLAAALALGRVLRTAVVFDTGVFRNASSLHMHTVPTWDHQSPVAYREQAAREIRERYPEIISFANSGAVSVKKVDDGTKVSLVDDRGRTWAGKKIILATGVTDRFPDIQGYAQAWGKTIFHCLFCHGYEQRNSERAGMLIAGKAVLDTEVDVAVHFGHLGKQFAKRISIFLDGNTKLIEDPRVKRLRDQGFEIVPQAIVKLEQEEGDEPTWIDVHLDGGSTERLSFLVHKPQTVHTSDLHAQLGVELTAGGDIKVKPPFGETTVEGVFAAGDCAVPLKQVAWAVATGASAGSGVSFQLVDSDTKQASGAPHMAHANQKLPGRERE